MAENGILPITIKSKEVEWIWTMTNGKKYGVTSPQAQSIRIISDVCDENGEGGTLEYVGDRHDLINPNETFYIV